MRENLKKSLFFILLYSSLISCGSTAQQAVVASPSEAESYGTTVNNPRKVEHKNVFPEFSFYIPFFNIIHNIPEAAEPKVEPKTDPDLGTISRMSRTSLGEWQDILQNNVIEAALIPVRDKRQTLYDAGLKMSEAFNAQNAPAISEELQTVSVDEPFTIGDTTVTWTVEYRIDAIDKDYWRFNFKNNQTDEIEASYLMLVDADMNPISGIFSYVNPKALNADYLASLNEDSEEVVRLISLAYDFSGENLSSVFRYEYFDADLGYFVAFHDHNECLNESECVGEVLHLTSRPPERAFMSAPVRYGWQKDDSEICLQLLDYDSGEAEMIDTGSFRGVLAGPHFKIRSDCVMPTPSWGDAAYDVSMLPIRLEDDASIATSVLLADDGWDLLSAEKIDQWISAESF